MTAAADATLDLVIRNALVLDGSGGPPVVEDVAVHDGRVAARSSRSGPIAARGAREIDAAGRWLTPGFLDIHTHYDAEVEVRPGLDESLEHGVTTVVFGNCSLSLALGRPRELLDLFTRVESLPRAVIESWLAPERVTWSSVGEYYDHLDRDLALGPNVATFLGHSNVRLATMGLERSLAVPHADAAELARMERVVEDALDAGYLGLSIDLLPWHRMDGDPHRGISIPSQQAAASEYAHLARPVRRRGRVLQATPNAMAKRSIATLVALSAGYHVRAPLKTTVVAALDAKRGAQVYRLATGLMDVANGFLGADLRFQALPVPFTVYSDGVTTPFFEEFPAGKDAIGATSEERRRMFADPAYRAAFRRQWRSGFARVFHRRFDDMWIVRVPGHADWTDRSFAEVAAELGRDPLDLFLDLVAEHDAELRWVTVAANHRPGPRRTLLGHRWTLPGFTDSGAHARNMGFQDAHLEMLAQSLQHPDWMAPERAVARLTSEPAEWLGLEAGRIAEGARADLVVLDPDALRRRTGGAPVEQRPDFMGGAMRMVCPSDGSVRHVLVGGREAYSLETGLAPAVGRDKLGRLLRARP